MIASRHGLATMAASTHPFTRWRTQRHTDKQRYKAIADDLKGVGRRMVIGGMHVHVGMDDGDQRIAVMNEMRPYLPLLLALSASSPFWQGENTGLKSYRTAINDATPRSGMPESFASWSDYQRTVGTLVRSDVIEDATKIWWDLRPSARFPTLELRITDVCPLIEDALCIAALFRCLCRSLWRRNKKRSALAELPSPCSEREPLASTALWLGAGLYRLTRRNHQNEHCAGRRALGPHRRGRRRSQLQCRHRSYPQNSCSRHERRSAACAIPTTAGSRRHSPARLTDDCRSADN